MNRDDILKLAIDAGFGHMSGFLMPPHVGHITAELTRFAELVAQHEITEILEMVDDLPELNMSNYNHDDVCDLNSKVCNLVLAIRARNTS